MAPHRRPNFKDIARNAGVSLATVDRVLNERGSVSEDKRRRVVLAARQLEVKRILPSPRHGLLRFDVILIQNPSDHFIKVERALMHYAEVLRSRVVLQRHAWAEHNEQQLLDLLGAGHKRRHGVAVVARETPAVRARLQALVDEGLPVVLLTSNMEELHGHHYAGVDNELAGRTAGHMLGSLAPAQGDVLLLVNSLDYLAHRQRAKGFCDVLANRFPGLHVNAPIECHDQPLRTKREVERALASRQLVGIYSTGAGSAGIAATLRDLSDKPVWVTHEATQEHAIYLQEGSLQLVLDQNPEAQALSCLQLLLNANGEITDTPLSLPTVRMMCRENLIVDC